MQKVERCRIKVDGRGWRRRRAKGGERYGAEAAISKGVKGRGGKKRGKRCSLLQENYYGRGSWRQTAGAVKCMSRKGS